MTRLNWILWQDQTNSCASFKCVIRGKLKKKVIGNLDVERRKKASVSCMFSVRNEAGFLSNLFSSFCVNNKTTQNVGHRSHNYYYDNSHGPPQKKVLSMDSFKNGSVGGFL